MRLFRPAQNQPGDAVRRFRRRDPFHLEPGRRVEPGELRAEAVAAGGNRPDAAPLRSHTSKTSLQIPSRRQFPSRATERAYWFSTPRVPPPAPRPSCGCPGAGPAARSRSPRSAPGTSPRSARTPRSPSPCRRGRRRGSPARGCPGEPRIASMAGGTQHVRDQHGEVRQPELLAPARPPWRWPGAVVSKPTAKNTTCRSGVLSAPASRRPAANRRCARRRPAP